MSIEGLEHRVIEWAKERDLYRNSDMGSRWDKFVEETDELMEEYFDYEEDGTNLDKVKLEAGDVIVTLINLLHPLELDLNTCLNAAYMKIKDRKGKMVNGSYVKEEDL